MSTPSPSAKRVRMTREQRHAQLLDISWRIIRTNGANELTLGRLAQEAGVAKPVVYDHFATRSGLLVALYAQYDDRQNAMMRDALRRAAPTLEANAEVIATTYVDCVLLQGTEIPGVSAALAGSPELDALKREYQAAWMAMCRNVLAPFSELPIQPASLWAVLGAAEALSNAAAAGELDAVEARGELKLIVMTVVR